MHRGFILACAQNTCFLSSRFSEQFWLHGERLEPLPKLDFSRPKGWKCRPQISNISADDNSVVRMEVVLFAADYNPFGRVRNTVFNCPIACAQMLFIAKLCGAAHALCRATLDLERWTCVNTVCIVNN